MRPFAHRTFGLAVGFALLTGTLIPAPAMAYKFGDDIEEIIVGAAVLAGVIAVATDIFKDTGRTWGYERGRNDDRSIAIDECSRTAEREAERYGRNARVRDVDVDRDGREYKVKGEVEVEPDNGWDRERRDYDRARFTCTARDGRITAFRFTDGFGYAYRN